MSELAFCKSFLSALDARPVKLSSDHIADARQYPAQSVYTLPRLPAPHPQRPNPPTTTSTPSSSSTISITLKPLKPTTPTLTLPSITPSKTSVYDLKQHYATESSISATKIKILYKKKPVPDSKTLVEVLGGDAGVEVEFGVMVMGGVAAGGTGSGVSSPAAVQSPPAVAPPTESEKGLASAGETFAGTASAGGSGKDVVATSEFWADLKNFVLQRTKDEVESERLVGVFKEAWEGSK